MPAPPLPKSCSCLTPVFASSLIAINNWQCAGDDSPGREDEWCDADRIVVTRRGSFELTIGGVAHFVDPLVATFWNRGDYFRVRHPVSATDECTIFKLSDTASDEMQKFSGKRAHRQSHQTFVASTQVMDGRVYLKHRRALSSARNTTTSRDVLGVEEAAFAFLQLVTPESKPGYSMPNSRERARVVARAREIVANDYAEPLSLARVARDANSSPFHLSRLFRQATGVTLHQAVMRLRLREGLEQLLDAPANISTVALNVGFASHSHFADAFREEYHQSPRAARQMLLKECNI